MYDSTIPPASEINSPLINLAAETAVLGSMMIDRDVILSVVPILQPDDFSDPDYQQIYRAIVACYEKRINPDYVTVQSQLGCAPDELGPLLKLLQELQHVVPTAIYAIDYAEEVKKASIHRQLTEATKQNLIDAATITDPAELEARIEERMSRIRSASTSTGFVDMRDDLSAAYDALDAPVVQPIRTQFGPLDRKFGGFLPGQLIVLAARPSVGKTALQSQISLGIAKTGKAVAIVSLEMSRDELRTRWVAQLANVNMHRHLQRRHAGKQDDDDGKAASRVADAFGELGRMSLYVDDRSSSSLKDILARCIEMYGRKPFDLLVIDHMHLIDVPNSRENRTQDIGKVSRALKGLARHLNVPVLALAQLNRAIETRGSDARPRLSDLRDSGTIEQDADVVMFLHRPFLYDSSQPEFNAELIVAKHRNGPIGDVELTWNPETAHFSERFGAGRMERS
jgi:replicative DNA helicase